MSRIYFHAPHGTAELSGRERAYMGTFCGSLLTTSLGLDRAYPSDAAFFRRMLPRDHYTQTGTNEQFLYAFKTWLHVGDGRFGINAETEPFTAALNTAIVIGGDAVKLLARLHGQCEVHAYVEGAHRAWLADIIDAGRESAVLRSGQGWEAVSAFLRTRDDEPVVTSYSVCQGFPNPSIAQWVDDRDGEGFWDLQESERWNLALKGLRESGGGLEMTPITWSDFYFGNGTSGFDVLEEATAADAVARSGEQGTDGPRA